ncbi:hypothetical protein E1H12_08860 [Geitlerinema sp. P-1104]|uniref:hypothetical protein n=1 Tax=Geitlerinema sp. P-1104 TaxID=2546230 RepID=UPI001476C427|nr:hypothetical protein [Geitlerinema sp. P-1104]NMG58629.1 hypothetical protein [Geitlerinema sp. P-1104]
MGRNAKLKQQRRQQQANSGGESGNREPHYKDTDFVEELQQQGYPSLGGDHAPEIPPPRAKS